MRTELTTLLVLCTLLLACGENQPSYDFDGDGWEDTVDCGPQDATIYPGAPEVCDDGKDNNCDDRPDDLDRDCNAHVSSTDGWLDVATGTYHSCGIYGDGEIECWGCEGYGEDHDQCDPPAGQFEQVVAGFHFSCALDASGEAQCWGGLEGAPHEGPYVQLAAGSLHTCGIRQDGSVDCWGNNEAGQCDAIDSNYQDTAAGTTFSCGLETGGNVLCWGCEIESNAPCDAPDGLYAGIAAAHEHTCALDDAGHVTCWGLNTWGQATPIGGEFEHLAAGVAHTCGVSRNGKTACWGCASQAPEESCQPPAAALTFMDAHADHTCGLSDGIIICWGNCEFGECSPP